MKLKEAAKFVGDFKSLAKEADDSLAKHKALELEIEHLLKAVVGQDIMIFVQNESVVDTSDLQTELERMKERFENYIIKKETEYAKLWNDWYKKCDECKYDKISYDKAYKDMQQKIEQLQAQLGDLQEDGVTRLKKYSELSAAEAIQADCGVKATNIILQALPPEIYALAILSGVENRPPMLEKDMYDSWRSRMEMYMLNRQHGRIILESVEHGPLFWPSVTKEGVTRLKKYSELSAAKAIQADCDVKATNIILQALPLEIYALVSTHKVAKDLWER
nr:hypothetical protein [Tanacetum cinerariifolium]